MLRISKIVLGKLIETLEHLMYTPVATYFSNCVPAYTRNTKFAGLVPEIPNAQRKPAMKVKALVIFLVLLDLVIFDEQGMTLSPLRNHSDRQGGHNLTILEPDGAIERAASEAPVQSYYFALTNHRAIINTEFSSSPADHQLVRRERGRAPPLRI